MIKKNKVVRKSTSPKKRKSYPHFSDTHCAEAFRLFSLTVAALRHPKTGCPWDLKQDHGTLRRYMIDEAYEAAEVMEKKSSPELCGELGDVLLQVVLNAQLAAEQGAFTLKQVIEGIDNKMKRRHPHVFRPQGGAGVSIESVWKHWKEAKAKEKGTSKASIFSDAHKVRFPATTQARKIGEIAADIKFDWEGPNQVFTQLRSEVEEVAEALTSPGSKANRQRELLAELGDVYFTLAQVCRHVGIDPEVAALSGNQKFLKRFALVEQLAKKQNIDLLMAPIEVKEQLWIKAKRQQKKTPLAES